MTFFCATKSPAPGNEVEPGNEASSTHHFFLDSLDPAAGFLHVLLAAGDDDDVTGTAVRWELNLGVRLLANLGEKERGVFSNMMST